MTNLQLADVTRVTALPAVVDAVQPADAILLKTTRQSPLPWKTIEVECAILTVFPVDAKEYIALLPLDENGQNESGEVYLYAFARTESGDPMLSNIESDEEYAKAAVAFDTVLQNAKDSMDKID